MLPESPNVLTICLNNGLHWENEYTMEGRLFSASQSIYTKGNVPHQYFLIFIV